MSKKGWNMPYHISTWLKETIMLDTRKLQDESRKLKITLTQF